MQPRLATLLALALTVPPLAADEQGAATPSVPDPVPSLWWGDVDGDARPDALVVQPDGSLRLMRNAAEGVFEDVTERLGLSELSGHHMAAFADVDGDGRGDLFLPAWRGPSRLMVQQEDGTLADETEARGLPVHAEPLDARWLDVDGDGALDLWLTTLHDDLVYKNDGRGRFEKLELGILPRNIAIDAMPEDVDQARAMRGVGTGAGGGGGYNPFAEPICALGIFDQANPNTCLPAASVPTAGHLLAVGSSALVPNLNADLFDGMDSSVFSQLGNKIDESEITNGAVSTIKLADDAVTQAKIAMGAVGSGEIAVDSIVGQHVQDGSLFGADIFDGSITADDIATNAVGSDEIAPGAVGSDEISSGAVGSTEIANSAVGPNEIRVNGVGEVHIMADSVGWSELKLGAVFDENVNIAANIGGAKINPDFAGQNVVTTGTGSFGDGGGDVFQVRGRGFSGADGLLGVQGTVDFQGVSSADWAGLEIGVAGLSAGAGTDNFGVFGHSNWVGIRGENATSPNSNYAELGRVGIGIRAVGTTLAGDFNGAVDISENLNLNGSLTSNSSDLLTIDEDVLGTGEATFGDGFISEWEVKGRGGLLSNGYLGVQGQDSFDGLTGVDLGGLEIGVVGVSMGSTTTDNVGVYGHATSLGVWGYAQNVGGAGVRGENCVASGLAYGVLGRAVSPGGWAVYAQGNSATTGVKSFVQPHPTDASKELRFVCLEGNESGTYFRGTGFVVDGRALIKVPEEFRLASEADGMTVQLTPVGALAMLAVESQDLEWIRVLGSADVEFHYFVNGVRRGFAGHRAIADNVGFVPEERGVPAFTHLPEAARRILVESGVLNPDFTPNEATAAALGWTLREPGSRLDAERDGER